MHFDVFNGDADGIIALVQLRLAEPKVSTLITGVKRDISLLAQVDVNKASSVTVLDISLEKNATALSGLLDRSIDVFYVDHHRPGQIPRSKFLRTLIDTDANTCTSLLINQYLKGQYLHWAIAAAFGDNMRQAALSLAKNAGLSEKRQQQLEALGIYINYNGYGRSLDDLHFDPAKLVHLCLAHPDPFTLIDDSASVFTKLANAYQQDMNNAKAGDVLADNDICYVVLLEDAAWARRVSGVYGNELANQAPHKAHVILTLNLDNTYTVSLRAPLNNKQGAGDLCARFATGGGRAAAAGINNLAVADLDAFLALVSQYYAG
jgi:hypothetical protein